MDFTEELRETFDTDEKKILAIQTFLGCGLAMLTHIDKNHDFTEISSETKYAMAIIAGNMFTLLRKDKSILPLTWDLGKESKTTKEKLVLVIQHLYDLCKEQEVL